MSQLVPLARIDAAIIDLDGTMIDTLGDFVAALNLMLGDLALAGQPRVDRQAVELMIGKGSENLIKSVINKLKAQLIQAHEAPESRAYNEVKLFELALTGYQKHYLTINGQHADVYPGVVQGLLGLQRAGLKLACLTNKPLSFAEALLKQKGLAGFFSHVFGGDSFAAKKPDALPVLETCKALGTLPARTMMLGDSTNDAQAARAAGCPVLLVTYGYNHGEPIRNVDADGYIDSLDDVIAQLQAPLAA